MRLEAFAELRLERRKPALHGSIVVAVAAPAHAALDPMCREDPLVVLARVGAALVRVVEQAGLGERTAAFFKISRSIRSSRFSFFSRAYSSRSALVSPVLPWLRS